MGADATLVNAAYAAGMANVPGDYSKIFNKQYEGLLLAHTAKWKAFGDSMAKVGELTTASIAQQNLWDQAFTTMGDNWEEFSRGIFDGKGVPSTTVGGLATDNAQKGVDDNVQHYEEGGSLPASHFNAVQERFENIKSEIKKIDNKKFRTRKDKKKRVELYKNYELLKQELLKDKATAIKYHSSGTGGENSLIDWTGMSKAADRGELDPELITLLKHVHDPKIDFEDYGIRVWINDKNEKIVDYFEGRLGIEYSVNNGGSMFNMMTYGTTPKTKSIKYRDLMKIIKYRPLEQVNNIDAVFDNIETQATAVIKGTKTPINSSWTNNITGGLKSESRKAFMAELKDGKTLNYLATTDLFGTGRIYENDIDNIIDVLTYEKILGKDLSQFDTSGDGVIDEKELSGIGENFLSQADKNKIKEVLTNPKTEEELVIAQNEFADYLTSIGEQHFNNNKPAAIINNNNIIVEGMPWANRMPTTEDQIAAHARVEAVVMEQPEIFYKKNKWTKEVGSQWGKPDVVTYVDVSKPPVRKTKAELIQLVGRGSTYGNIPTDFDWSTVKTNPTTSTKVNYGDE